MLPTPPAAHVRPLEPRGYLVAIIATTAPLWLFWWWSRDQPWIGLRGQGWFTAPPVYGTLEPAWSAQGWLALGACAAFALLAWVLVHPSVGSAVFLAVAVPGATAFAFAVNLVRGDAELMLRALAASPYALPDYHSDSPTLRRVGVRAYVTDYADVYWAQMLSVQNRTHPPGALVVHTWLADTFGGRFGTAVVIAGVGMTSLVAAWLLGRLTGGERAGRLSALLVVVAPSLLLYSFTAMDALFAGVLSMCGAVLLLAVHRRSHRLAALAGALLGLASFLTYAAVLVALAGAVAGLVVVRDLRRGAGLLLAAGAGGVLSLAALRVGVGFDLLASNAMVVRDAYQPRPAGYWAAGAPVAYLLCAGVFLAGLGLVGVARHRPPMTLALLGVLVAFALAPKTVTGLYPGEVERTWLFSLPFLAAAAGRAWADWEQASQRVRRFGVPVVVGLGGAYAVLLQALYDTVR